MSEHLIQEMISAVGKNYVLSTHEDTAPYVTDWRKIFTGKALAVVFPGNTEEVAKIIKICADANIAIVPQGGNTGLCGGSTPDGSGDQIVLNLKRLNKIQEIDIENLTIRIESGCILKTIQEKTATAGFLFPLSLGSEGSCMIGGNLATNAGGTKCKRIVFLCM